MDPYAPPSFDHSFANDSLDDWPADASPFSIAWMIIRKYFGLLVICYLIVWLPLELIMSYAEAFVIEADDVSATLRLQQSLGFWFGIIADGAIVATLIDAYSHSHPKISYSFALSWKRYGKIWTTRLCVGFIAVIGVLLLVIPGIYFLVRAIYADSIAVAENTHGPTAIRRSFELTRGRFGESFLIAVVVWSSYVLAAMAWCAIVIPAYIVLEEYTWLWIAEAIVALIFEIPIVYSHTLLYCWYRRLDEPNQHIHTDVPTWDELRDSNRVMS